MVSPAKDFKEQMVEARRSQILMGAAQVFAEKGFYKATTREIAKAAGVSEGTIYNYFDNKRELLFALIELVGIQSLKDVVQDHRLEDPRTFFTALLHNRYQLLHDRGPFLAPVMAEIFADADLRGEVYEKIAIPITVHLEQFVQARIESGKFRPFDPLIVTRALVGAMVFNAALKLTNLDARYQDIPAELMIEQLVSLVLDGLLINGE